MNENIQGEIIRLKNLPQFRNKTEAEIAEFIQNRSKPKEKKEPQPETLDSINIEELFIDKEEKKYGKDLLERYLGDFSLETISDVNLLKQLIYLEVFQKLRLQKTADTFQKENNAVPLQILDSIHKNLDKIIQLKESLRLTRGSSLEQNDAYKALQLLKKKAEIWRKENQVTRERTCPYCAKRILWIMRPEVWDMMKHPFFKDRILGNEHIVALYKQNKLTKEDLSKIFEVSNDYVDWLISKWEGNITQVPTIEEIKE